MLSLADLWQLQAFTFSMSRFYKPMSNHSATYRVFVKCFHSGKVLHFESDLSCDLGYLKRSIAEREDITLESQFLFFRQQLLLDDATPLWQFGLCYGNDTRESHIQFLHLVIASINIGSVYNRVSQSHRLSSSTLPLLLMYQGIDSRCHVLPIDRSGCGGVVNVQKKARKEFGLVLEHIDVSQHLPWVKSLCDYDHSDRAFLLPVMLFQQRN